MSPSQFWPLRHLRIFLPLLVLAVLLIGLFWIKRLNEVDEPLNPELARLMAIREPVPPKAKEAYQLALRQLIPNPKNPLAKDSVITGKYIKEKEFAKIEPQIHRLVEEERELLKAYDQIVELGAMGEELPSELKEAPNFRALLLAWKIRALELNQWLRTHREAEALKVLQNEFQMHQASLIYPNTILSTMLHVAVMRYIRAFAQSAGMELPTFAALLTREAQETLRTKLESGPLMLKSLTWELNWVQNLVGSYQPEKEDDLIMATLMKTAPTNHNRLLNSLYACWFEAPRPVWLHTYVYPVVGKLTDIFCTQVAGRASKIEQELSELRAPFEFKDLP